MEGKLEPREDMIHLGRAVVRETFRISRVGTIAGCHVTQGVSTLGQGARYPQWRRGLSAAGNEQSATNRSSASRETCGLGAAKATSAALKWPATMTSKLTTSSRRIASSR